MKISELAGMERLRDLIHTVIATAFVIGERPVSCIVVGPSGGGKSKTLIRFQEKFIVRADDITSAGVADLLEHDTENKIKTLLVPEFNTVLSHKASVTNLVLANLLSITDDGTVRIMDGRAHKEIKHNPVSLITAATDDTFMRYHRKWKDFGLARRIVPLYYRYSLQTQRQAQTMIRNGRMNGLQLQPIPLSKLQPRKVIIPKKLTYELEALSVQLALVLGQYWNQKTREAAQGVSILPMSPQITVRTIASANAIRFGRSVVSQKDVEQATDFVAFANIVERVAL